MSLVFAGIGCWSMHTAAADEISVALTTRYSQCGPCSLAPDCRWQSRFAA